MPLVSYPDTFYHWVREKGNFVAIKFTKPSEEKVTEAFSSPSNDNIDNDLVAYFKTMSVGDAIEVNLKESGKKTERSLKVSIGKHASLANRKVENKASSDGNFIFRVTEIVVPQNGSNGTSTATPEVTNANVEALTQEPTTETASRSRNR